MPRHWGTIGRTGGERRTWRDVARKAGFTRRLCGGLLAAFVAMAWAAAGPARGDLLVEPGVTAGAVASPSTITPETLLARTITITNSNADKNKTYDLGGTIVAPSGNVHVALNVTGNVPGSRKNRQVQMPVPPDFVFVPGSLTLTVGSTPPVKLADPPIANGQYVVTIDLPQNSAVKIEDQLIFRPSS